MLFKVPLPLFFHSFPQTCGKLLFDILNIYILQEHKIGRNKVKDIPEFSTTLHL
jgi:hypothetical protein